MPLNAKNIQKALQELRKSKKRNFNQSIDLIVNLRDIDMKKPEGKIQTKVELPNAIGKQVKVCVLADGDLALRAKREGADIVLGSKDIEALINDKKRQRQIANNNDAFLAAAPLMPLVGRVFGSILGPRGKMPTPISPTAEIKTEIDRHKRMILIRTRGQPVLQCRIGTEKMSDKELLANIQHVMTRIESALGRGIKNIKSMYLKSTMQKPIKVEI